MHDTWMRSKQIKDSLSRGPGSQAWWGKSTCKLSTWEKITHLRLVSLSYIGKPVSESGFHVPGADLKLTTQLTLTLNFLSSGFLRTSARMTDTCYHAQFGHIQC